jgi:hypothetical protein
MDFAKMITEQYQKQMAKKNAMGELKKASLADQQEMWHNVFALNEFPISHEHCGNGKELSTGKTIYYYEVIVSQSVGW